MTERELQDCVIETARILGWFVAHFRSVPVKRGPRVVWETPVQADGAGFPDLVMVRKDRVVWVELKREGGKPSERQRIWLALLEQAKQEVHLWKPKDWLEGKVEEVLR